MTYKTIWTMIKGGEEYDCEVSFEASSSSLSEISINQVTRVRDGYDIDPEMFQSKLTPEEETDLHKELNAYADDYNRYITEDTTT